MASRGGSVYTELFDQLKIPERLEPQNIAAMLEAGKLAGKSSVKVIPVETMVLPSIAPEIRAEATRDSARASITMTETAEKTKKAKTEKSDTDERRITVAPGRKKTSVVYRSVTSVAACAALALGILGYMQSGTAQLPSEVQPNGGAYASDYNDVHKTFEKYYVDDEGKKTLDSAIEDIEHSYNEGNASNTTQTSPESDPGKQPEVTDPVTDPAVPAPKPPAKDEPSQPEKPETQPIEIPSEADEDILVLPENPAKIDNSDIAFGSGFLIRRDGNVLRILTTNGGTVSYNGGNIYPVYEENSSKTLSGFFVDGTKVVAVYSNVTGETAASEMTEPDSSLISGDSMVGDIIGSFGTASSIIKQRNSVEICVYDIVSGEPRLMTTAVHGGSLIDMNFINGALYTVTAYNEYRNAPIIGVEDLESYVPSYTVNGEKLYVQPSDIMLPDSPSTTDYTVISGMTVNGQITVQAVLGYEKRVILKNGAVYLLGYDNGAGNDSTTVRVFSLSGGKVVYAGFTDLEGVALSGDGISSFGDYIGVSTIKKTDSGYVTTLGIYDGTMNLISYVAFPAALTSAKRTGTIITMSGAKDIYRVDLSEPAEPVLLDEEPAKNAAKGLLEFDGGYVALTKTEDGLVLSKIVKDGTGALKRTFKTIVSADKTAFSKALDNNGRMFVSGNLIGVPYGYFDGYDYCYRYEVFKATAEGFKQVGAIESHEHNGAYEPEKAVQNGNVLYIFSDGRVYSAVVSEDSVSLLGTANIVESAYSGH